MRRRAWPTGVQGAAADAPGSAVFGLDHRIPNGTPLENYRYYVQRGREILGLPALDGKAQGWGRMAFGGSTKRDALVFDGDKVVSPRRVAAFQNGVLIQYNTPPVSSGPRTFHAFFHGAHATRLLVQPWVQTPRGCRPAFRPTKVFIL